MAYPTAHILLSFGGPLYSGGEDWTNTLRLFGVGAEGDGSEAADQAQCDAYALLIKNWWQVYTGSSMAAGLSWVKMNRVNTLGLYKHQYTALTDFAPVIASSTSATSIIPAQVALVATFRTAAKRGPAHSGRIFLPVPVNPLASDGRLSTGNRDYYVTQVKNLLDSINAEDTSMYVAVGSKIDAGQIRRVLKVEVGRVLDTMRSRRTKLSEEHAGQDLATP